MHRWWQIGIRNWRAKPVRTLLAMTAVALGVAVVVWVTCCYESVRRSVTATVEDWIGRAHVTVESVGGRWALFDEKVAEGLDKTDGVRHMVRRTLETVWARRGTPATSRASDSETAAALRFDIVGVELPGEIEFRNYPLTAGRMLRPGDDHVVLVEALLAREWSLSVGDHVELWYGPEKRAPEPFEIVGLVDRRRVSSHQLPMAWTTIAGVQRLTNYAGKIKAIDFMLANDSPESLRRTSDVIRRVVRSRDKTLKVSTTEAQLRQLRSAENQLQFVLMLISCVALLTAFFIILSTMIMGVADRMSQLGLLRCVGATRGQTFALVLIEVLPVSAAGIALGVPLGLFLQWLTIGLVPDYVGQFAISWAGVALAIGGGLGTALLGAMGPAVRAAVVSPIAATRIAVARGGAGLELLAAACGGLMLLGQQCLLGRIDSETPYFALIAVCGLFLLYGGYALMAPLAVGLLGEAAVRAAAIVLRVRRQLVSDQVGRRPWRSAAVCCGLMVGLSLIVALLIHSESVKAGWQFPKEFPEAMIYSWQDVPLERVQAAAKMPGVRSAMIADDIRCKLIRKGSGFLDVLDPFYRFIAGDPDTFPHLIHLVYLEGNEREALARLRRGGAVLVTREFCQARGIHLNDRVTLQVGDVKAKFDVAGVIASPALDIAVSFFNAGGEFQIYAVGSFIGTLADAKRLFGREIGRLLLFNFDAGTESSDIGSAEFEHLSSKPRRDEHGRIIPEAVGHLRAAAETSGSNEEKQVVQRMIDAMHSPQCAFVTARQLKQSIDANINRVTLLLAGIPSVGLLVAALGVANLMMANIASRVRQIAVMRAVGATQFQVIRLVIAEALVLGLLGTGMGLALGLHLGRSSNQVTHAIWGFQPEFAVPWPMVLAGSALAMGLCLLAGIGPARYAGRSNIVAAMQSM